MSRTAAAATPLTVKPYVAEPGFSNAIRTSKYRWWTFIPLNLFEQFHNLSNVYFLFVMCLQMVQSISITSGKPIIVMPLLFVLTVSAIKDLWEDLKRASADSAENRSETLLNDKVGDDLADANPLQWCKVRCGHVLIVKRNQRFPADMLLVKSSDGSTCNVETMNLDGETNLKQKMVAIPEDMPWETFVRNAHIEYERASAELYDFKGAIVQNDSNERAPLGIGISSLLLRGSSLQHTEWVKGIVLYCGHDCRIMRNSRGSRFKASMLDVQMNKVMISLVICMILISFFGGAVYSIWMAMNLKNAWYLKGHDVSPVQRLFVATGTWLLQLGNMVPISMLVTLTTVKFMQGKFLEMDDKCKDARKNTFAQAHTSQVLESLGQITHVFSDKTGTLTRNEMVYKSCSTGGVIYGMSTPASIANSPTIADSNVDFDVGAQQLLSDLPHTAKPDTIAGFLLCHALCHTVTVDTSEAPTQVGGCSGPPTPVYAAASPDELALVSAARVMGLAYFKTSHASMTILVTDKRLHPSLELFCGSVGQPAGSCWNTITFEVLAICDFDNDRKRMSAVFRFPNDHLVLFVKGADTSILPYVAETDQVMMNGHLSQFAKAGLRTLCLGFRKLDPTEFDEWNVRYRAALSCLSHDRAQHVHQLSCELEVKGEIELLGSTAIEDRLQDGVPEVIERLRLAGITIWLLTGDKLETAISIGMSSSLLTESMLNTEVDGEVVQIEAALHRHVDAGKRADGKAITITGPALASVLASRELTRKFYFACLDCKSVLACRVSPKQKADVVQLAKSLHHNFTRIKPVTLAIGDGANDVAMITAAHVGVGLSGKEGAQAARSADFAFSQFQFLTRLLFVHGREAYRRNSVLVNYNFYKNVVLVLPPYLYGPMMTFSGQPFYDQVMYQLYNMVFTAFPIIVYALLDRACNDLSELEADPSLYGPGIRKEYFSIKVFFLWMATAALQAIWSVVLGFACFEDENMWIVGAEVYFWVVLGANLTLMKRVGIMFPITIIVLLGSVVSYPIVLIILEIAGVVDIQTSSVVLSLRSVLVTLLFVGGFLGIGEPILAYASSGRRRLEMATPSLDEVPLFFGERTPLLP